MLLDSNANSKSYSKSLLGQKTQCKQKHDYIYTRIYSQTWKSSLLAKFFKKLDLVKLWLSDNTNNFIFPRVKYKYISGGLFHYLAFNEKKV